MQFPVPRPVEVDESRAPLVVVADHDVAAPVAVDVGQGDRQRHRGAGQREVQQLYVGSFSPTGRDGCR